MNLRVQATMMLLVACSHTRPNEMTAPEHRNEAAIHRSNAQSEQARYESYSLQRPEGPSPAVDQNLQRWTSAYNPTASHLEAADREMRAAAEHLSAARALEAFEDQRCGSTPKAERAACPLLASSVATVTEQPDGIALTLVTGTDAAQTFRRLDCHLAYSEAQGFVRPSCPLFVKGMKLALERGADRLTLTSNDVKVAEELKAQARRIFVPRVPTSSR